MDVEAVTVTALRVRSRVSSSHVSMTTALRDVAGAVHFDGRVLLAETIQKDPRRRVGIGMRVSCVSEEAVTPFQKCVRRSVQVAVE